MSEEPIVKPIASPKRDFKQLGKNSQAVAGELREFLASLKGKSPKEMMGAVAESSLAQSLLISTVVMMVLVFSFSAIPYYLKQGEEAAQAEQKAKESPGKKAEDKSTDSTAEQGGSSGEGNEAPNAPKTAEQKTADILGVGEVADPDSNPLDSDGGDLLDGLDEL
jgi:hypothetical protein